MSAKLVIKIVDKGTQITDPNTGKIEPSKTGHMWWEITDNSGQTYSYGFAPDPDNHGKPFAPGHVSRRQY
jgi:hypothetical protein